MSLIDSVARDKSKPFLDYNISKDETLVLKGIAILAMLWHHLFFQHPEYGFCTFQLAQICKVCVSIFVFLSGYGLTITYNKFLNNNTKDLFPGTLKFVLRRYVKFYSNYWLVFLITVPLGVFVFGRTLNIPYVDSNIALSLVKDFLGLQGFYSYNPTWWFNRLIIVLWLLFPVFYWVLKNKYISAIILFLLFFVPKYLFYPILFLNRNLPTYGFVFAIGICLAMRKESWNLLLNRISTRTLLFISIFAFVLLVIVRQNTIFPEFSGVRIDSLLTVAITLIVLSFRRLAKLELGFLSYLGKYATNMYLTHSFFLLFFPGFLYGLKFPIFIYLTFVFASWLFSFLLARLKNLLYLQRK